MFFQYILKEELVNGYKISIQVCAKSSFTLYWILHTSRKISVCPQS